jgi:hypothetical protein
VGLAGDNPFGLLQGVILLENEQKRETTLIASCLSADPFRDNGFCAVFIDLAGLYGGSSPPSSYAIAKLFLQVFIRYF